MATEQSTTSRKELLLHGFIASTSRDVMIPELVYTVGSFAGVILGVFDIGDTLDVRITTKNINHYPDHWHSGKVVCYKAPAECFPPDLKTNLSDGVGLSVAAETQVSNIKYDAVYIAFTDYFGNNCGTWIVVTPHAVCNDFGGNSSFHAAHFIAQLDTFSINSHCTCLGSGLREFHNILSHPSHFNWMLDWISWIAISHENTSSLLTWECVLTVCSAAVAIRMALETFEQLTCSP